ncbi:hypothetical protein [Paradevosia shaoguanensis]|uniref:Uncharacterized protein n=1 Tax=Paradevosia shaoguanensis TaxID=1335043 RepID=A0AA41U9Q7_9HYPH|nr:hypothetical protein [Paradevosia shaoguanensis]MCF1741167.1 hypothetical protein [Paradevosia shaoguanensis]MCI0125650.1 hypothetical protein [Paradevosia shaoguanensis]
MHQWRQIKCNRFDSEPMEDFLTRKKRIEEIVTGFRWGRYRDNEADAMEIELAQLRSAKRHRAAAIERSSHVA